MKYMKKKKLIAVMALLIVAASFGGCNSSNTTATISFVPVSSKEEKAESEAVSSEATTSSAAEVSSKAEAPATSSESAVSSALTTVSQPVVSSAQAVTSEPAASTPATTSQPVSSAATSAPSTKTVSAPTQPSGSTKAFEDMTIEEQDQWLLDQLNQQLGNIEAHEYGTDEGNSAESTQPAEGVGDVYEAIRLINEERVKAGLNELEIDDTMMEMAAVRAKEATIPGAQPPASGVLRPPPHGRGHAPSAHRLRTVYHWKQAGPGYQDIS